MGLDLYPKLEANQGQMAKSGSKQLKEKTCAYPQHLVRGDGQIDRYREVTMLSLGNHIMGDGVAGSQEQKENQKTMRPVS